MGEVEKNDVEVQDLHLIDVSCEDDGLIASSSDGFRHHQSSENQKEHRSFDFLELVEATNAEDIVDVPGQSEHLPQPSESLEPERTRKSGKCNLRKSLAWDSAFFTSSGVLDPEELSSMMEEVERGGKHVLPGIQEDDIRESIDSIATLDSDSLTLESLEADLFQDIRASIQKSSKASSVAKSSSKAGSGETKAQTIHSSRNVDLASRNKSKPKPASKNSISTQGPGKMIKHSTVCPQVRQPAARSGESTSMLPKLPKALGRANPISTAPNKRASLGANRVKMEKDNAKSSTVAGRGALPSKMPGLGVSRSIVPRPTLSYRSSSSGSSTATKTEPTTSCSSLDSSGSASSENVGKSPLNSMRRKIDSSTANPPSSGSSLKTASRIASRNKTQSGNSCVSAYLMSATKLSSSISPASSISEWSSESSSSTSIVNQRSNNSKASPDTSSRHRGVSVDSDAHQDSDFHNHSYDQFSVGHENQVTGLRSQCVIGALTGTGTLPHPASAKPSGLRMPSPKIGFFDGAKSAVRTPKGGMQSHSGVPSGLPKAREGSCSPSGDSNKAKLGQLHPASTVTAIRNIKPETQQTALSMKPTSLIPLRPPLIASTKVSSALRAVRNCPGLSPKVQNVMSPKTGGKSQLKAGEVGAKGPDRGKNDPDSCLKNKMSPEVKGSAHLKDIEITPINGEGPNVTCDSSSSCNIGNMNPSQKVGEDAQHGQNHLKNDMHLLCNTDEKEKAHFEIQADGLRRHVEVMDLNKEIQKELIGDSLYRSDVNCPDNYYSPELSCSKELLVYGQKDESLNILSKPTPPSLSPTTSEITASMRIPFAVKNSFFNRDGLFDSSTGSTVEVVEKTATLPFLESAQKENN